MAVRSLRLSAVALVAAGALLGAGAAVPAQAAGAAGGHPVTVGAPAIESDPTPEEQERLREIAGSIWTPELAAGWNMNAEVADVLSEVTGGILKCSEAFALVPRPPGFVPGLSYLRQYWKQIRDYFLVVRDNRTYRACVVSAAAHYRSIIEMASAGI
ncbi:MULTISPECIES: hypothetical protein [unclassified Streptomyces]|uniref:hypothetical protein n=1 Tax=unclassified Streptomyces TaxID=2593676 RepID=UPI002DDA4C7A|nr:hypothetical protein [Streptomyces sp. NBC_01294]WRZ55387.1 hypothetical protein OG534_02125 [Streptomyces sp. NBC_01294]WRZ61309.1 hypothetical protein OG534_35375 [Streptomyces sp. NBC_01294]